MSNKEDKELDMEELERQQITFKDRVAMWIAGMAVVFIPCLILVILVVLVTLLMFTR